MPTPKQRRRQGTQTLCRALREIYDANKDIAKDRKSSPEDVKAGNRDAEKARKDAAKWGCTWAERV